MNRSISRDRCDEEPKAKARWFQTLTVEERADLLCSLTDIILEINMGNLDHKNAQPVSGRILVLKNVTSATW